MDWNKDNIIEIVEFINNELKTGVPMIKIEREYFGENERVIHKRLLRLGYKKTDNQYRPQENITSNLTPSNEEKECKITRKLTSNLTTDGLCGEMDYKENMGGGFDFTEKVKMVNNEVDMDKLNLLLSNLDNILRLIPRENSIDTTGLRSGVNSVSSLRVDTGLYKAIKGRATRDNVNIADIVNRALEDYLNNYL